MGTDKRLGLGNWKLILFGKRVGDSPLGRARPKWGNDINPFSANVENMVSS